VYRFWDTVCIWSVDAFYGQEKGNVYHRAQGQSLLRDLPEKIGLTYKTGPNKIRLQARWGISRYGPFSESTSTKKSNYINIFF
jgi:hypothetical protein